MDKFTQKLKWSWFTDVLMPVW